MSSKQTILAELRAARLPDRELPTLDFPVLSYADPRPQFQTMVQAVGGQVCEAPSREALVTCLSQLEPYRAATNIWSLVEPVPSAGPAWDAVEDPHELESLDFCVVPGEFGVAENGAVWVPDSVLRHRVALWIAQHVALVVPAGQIVNNMHEAYARLHLSGIRFGVFISGPSKTADIEQSLVIGAHGPRSLTVILVHD